MDTLSNHLFEVPLLTLTQLKSKNSWYGSWPRKSAASIQVARETILADKPAIGNAGSPTVGSRPEAKPPQVATPGRPPLLNVGKSKGTSDVTLGDSVDSDVHPTTKQPATEDKPSEPKITPTTVVEDKPPAEVTESENTTTPGTASSWLGRWAKPRNNTLSESEVVGSAKEEVPPSDTREPTQNQDLEIQSTASTGTSRPSSWFGLWSNESRPRPVEPPTAAAESLAKAEDAKIDPPAKAEPPKVELPATSQPPAAPQQSAKTQPSAKPQAPAEAQPSTQTETSGEQPNVISSTEEQNADKGNPPVSSSNSMSKGKSSWAFWSTDGNKSTTEPVGQIAVSGESSQSHPEPIAPSLVEESTKRASNKRERPLSVDLDDPSKKVARKPSSSTSSQDVLPSKPSPPNLILPSVKSTYKLVENPSLLQQITRLILHHRQPSTKHLSLMKDTPKIKKAVAIGVHGLVPAALLRTVIGQPTGTSIRFANNAAAAIRRWADLHGCADCEIEKVALEGEGRIAERVDNLWKLLLNWVDHIRTADFVMVACHSQGVPVAVMLVAKLVEFGVVSSARVGICAMGMSLTLSFMLS